MAWTSPRTWVAGEKPSASTLNTHIRDNLAAIGDAWTSYTPTVGNWTVNNGTLAAALMQAGKLTTFRIKLTLGTTTVVSGSPTFTLPVNATAARTVNGLVMMWDDSATSYFGGWAFNSSASTLVVRSDASASLSTTVPFTWANLDVLLITGTYEAA